MSEGYRPIPQPLLNFLEELKDEDNADEYEIFIKEHTESFIAKLEKDEQNVLDSGFQIIKDSSETLRETCLQYPLEFTHGDGQTTTVFLMGTEHNVASIVPEIETLYEELNPDIIAIEWPPEYDLADKMFEIWNRHDGDLQNVVQNADQADLIKVAHFMKDEGFCKKIREWGTLLSTDMGVSMYLAKRDDKKLFFIDQNEAACDRQIGDVWGVSAMYLSLKHIYGIDCVEDDLEIENTYQLIASLDLMHTSMMKQETDLGHLSDPKTHVLGTHLRDLYMTKRLHQICEGNPGKTILCNVGACHTFGMRELWDYYIPQSIIATMGNTNKGKKALHKIMRKFGGSLMGKYKCLDLERLRKR